MTMTWVPLLAVVVLLLAGVGIYNSLIALRARGDAAWSDVNVQLKRRHDLVGNLVETVKGYAAHERSTLEQVIEARNRATGAAASGHPARIGGSACRQPRAGDRARRHAHGGRPAPRRRSARQAAAPRS